MGDFFNPRKIISQLPLWNHYGKCIVYFCEIFYKFIKNYLWQLS